MDLKIVSLKGQTTDTLIDTDSQDTSLYQILDPKSLELVAKRHQESKNLFRISSFFAIKVL